MSTTATTSTNVPIETSLRGEAADAVTAALQPTLVELLDLALATKQLHWAVVGRRFKPVHEHLDEVHGDLAAYSDTVAEYLSTIAVVPDGRSVRVASDAVDEPLEVAFLDDEAVIERMTARLKGLVERLRERQVAVAPLDPAAEDLVIELIRVFDKHLWMTSAQR